MNAIAYHPDRGFIDPYNGMKHIEEQCIKSVRDAKERFEEDALRILRGVRFSAQLGFSIEENTIQGIKSCKSLLANISKERIRDEFLKICLSDRPEYINKLYELELLQYILPEFIPAYDTPQNHPHHIYYVAGHTIEAMRNIPKTAMLRLTMLLHDIAKPMTRKTDAKGIDHFYNHPEKGAAMAKGILKDLRLDNQTINEVTKLVLYHDYHLKHKLTRKNIKRLLNALEVDLFDALMLVNEADARAQNPDKLEDKLEAIKQAKILKADIIAKGECYNLKGLAIDGKDLIQAGLAQGKAIGENLEKALAYVINDPNANEKDKLISYIRKGIPH